MFEIFQDMQDITEEDMRKVEKYRRWCTAGAVGVIVIVTVYFHLLHCDIRK
jgi:hypothetical protein